MTFLDYRGDSAQTAAIDSLSSTVIDGNGLTGTYTVKLHFYTVDSVANLAATGSRNLADATWSGSLATLAALALAPGGSPCVSSDAVGTITTLLRANGNVAKLIMCITPVPDSPKYKVSISVRWTPPNSPPLPVSGGERRGVVWRLPLLRRGSQILRLQRESRRPCSCGAQHRSRRAA